MKKYGRSGLAGGRLNIRSGLSNTVAQKKNSGIIQSKTIHALGRKFASKLEYEFYAWLKQHDFDFKYQPKYNLKPTISRNVRKPLLNNIENKPGKIDITPDFEVRVEVKKTQYTIIVELKSMHKKWDSKKRAIVKNVRYTEYMLRYNLLAHKLYEEKQFNTLIRIVDTEHMHILRNDLIRLRQGQLNISEFCHIDYITH